MRTDPLVLNYPVRIRAISLGVIVLIASIFYFSPRLLENTTSLEKDEKELNAQNEVEEVIEEELDEFELRLRRLGKL